MLLDLSLNINQTAISIYQYILKISAIVFALAVCAVGSHPDGIKLLHDRLDHRRVGGDDAGLEIPAFVGLGPHPRPGQIGTAGVSERPINEQIMPAIISLIFDKTPL